MLIGPERELVMELRQVAHKHVQCLLMTIVARTGAMVGTSVGTMVPTIWMYHTYFLVALGVTTNLELL